MAKHTPIHVVPHDNGAWAVRREDAKRVSSTHPTQAAAAKAGRAKAKAEKTELLIHGRDGEIRSRDSYGNDPYPPKG